MNTSFDSYVDRIATGGDRLVMLLSTYLTKAAHPKPGVKVFEAPATWWQMFKRDHFPAFLLARFPVRTEKTVFEYDSGTYVCPHMELPWTDRKHIDFITLQEPGFDRNRRHEEEDPLQDARNGDGVIHSRKVTRDSWPPLPLPIPRPPHPPPPPPPPKK